MRSFRSLCARGALVGVIAFALASCMAMREDFSPEISPAPPVAAPSPTIESLLAAEAPPPAAAAKARPAKQHKRKQRQPAPGTVSPVDADIAKTPPAAPAEKTPDTREEAKPDLPQQAEPPPVVAGAPDPPPPPMTLGQRVWQWLRSH